MEDTVSVILSGVKPQTLNCTEFLDGFKFATRLLSCGIATIELTEVGASDRVRITFTAQIPASMERNLLDLYQYYTAINNALIASNATCNSSSPVLITGVIGVTISNGANSQTSSSGGVSLYAGLAAGAAAAFLLLCMCRRRRQIKHKQQETVIFLNKEGPLSVSFQAESVFDWLDQNGNGYITPEDLASALDIPLEDAEALIAETSLALHGDEDVQPKTERPILTKTEFKNVMRNPDFQESIIVPERSAEKYAEMFDTIDTMRSGAISPGQLALAIGVEADDQAEFTQAFAEKDELGFEDFVALMRQSEIARAAMTMLDLLEDKGQGKRLADAVVTRNVAKDPRKGPSTVTLPDGTRLNDYLRQKRETETAAQPSFDVQFRKQTNTNMVLNEQITDVSDQTLKDIWDNLTPDESGLVTVDDLRAELLTAHASGDLVITDNDLLEAVMAITETAEDNVISFEAFAAAMLPFFGGGDRSKPAPPPIMNLSPIITTPRKQPSFKLTPGSLTIRRSRDSVTEETFETRGDQGAQLYDETHTTEHAFGTANAGDDLVEDEASTSRASGRTKGVKPATAAAVLNRFGSTKSSVSSAFSEDSDVDMTEDEGPLTVAAAGVLPKYGYHVILYTSTTHSDHFQEGNERRIMHLLDVKGLEYEIVFVDLDENRQRRDEMFAISGVSELPQVHIKGNNLGGYSALQEMEDSGSLDIYLKKEGIDFVGKNVMATPRNAVHTAKTDGPLTVHCTSKFALVRWNPRQAKLSTRAKFEWMLLMDDDPIYVGPQTSFLVQDISGGNHVFELSALDMEGEFLENAEGEQVFGEVRISPPSGKPAPTSATKGQAAYSQATARTPQPVTQTPRELRESLKDYEAPSLFKARKSDEPTLRPTRDRKSVV